MLVSLRSFVVKQLLSRIYALPSVKFSGLKLWLCKKSDKYEVWPQVLTRTTLSLETLKSNTGGVHITLTLRALDITFLLLNKHTSSYCNGSLSNDGDNILMLKLIDIF